MTCTRCGTENRPGRKFCSSCGAALSVACPSCGAANEPDDRFCGECGSVLSPSGAQPLVATTSGRTAHASERRLVSVLFADLVGFTTLSESRDAEEVRDLLTRYFDTCRQLITRYGGVVEKFIGDAVMAVWGTPVAQEDDAERAVRAALDLVGAVAALGLEAGSPALRARAGVLTGEAAVTLGATAEGMVAGDLVNTASRIQSAAEPGSVFVGDATRRATETAIVYEDAGTFDLKGKAEPVRLWRARRVVGGVKGIVRSERLEAPFVGRDRELRLLKELFHASSEERHAHLVSVIGVAGVGKSRLAWEFFKYIDGLADTIRWHRGRCLAYGEGVTYWALAEMVRTRADIVEGEDPTAALAKLRATTEDVFSDPEERRWAEPRLANLLGLEGGPTSRDHGDLFAAWRMFYERLADEMPTIMLFEDCQWADQGLLDFIDYLLEWSRNHPLFVVTLSRPELLDKRPTWSAAARGATSMFLDPLSPPAMRDLLEGLVPGGPEALGDRILERAEGIPLYAVETVRMLIDRGLLVQEGAIYTPAAPITSLEVPETLHALIAARLDGLKVEERRLLQDAAVLGRTFTKQALVLLSGEPDTHVESLLSSLVRKEILSIQDNPLSPERGQYGFLQDLVKHVAYETISKRDRKTAHLAAATTLLQELPEDEIVEVIASHYVNAYRLAPDAPDAPEIKHKARAMLARAGERAASLAAMTEAERYFVDAAGLADDDPTIRGEMLERAGVAAKAAGEAERAVEHWNRASELFAESGFTHRAARVAARTGEALWDRGRIADALEGMDRAFRILENEEPDEDLAALAAELGRFMYFAGHDEAALERIETALRIAEDHSLPEVLSQALNTKAIILWSIHGRGQEALGLLRHALGIALEADVSAAALRAYYNLTDLLGGQDQYREATEQITAGLALARRVGNRFWEWLFLGDYFALYALGEWDLLLERASELPIEKASVARGAFTPYIQLLPRVYLFRGELEAAKRAAAVLDVEGSDDIQERASFHVGRAMILRAEGDAASALAEAEATLALRSKFGMQTDALKEAITEAVEAAFEIGDLAKVEELLAIVDAIPRGGLPRYLEAHGLRFRARLAAARGDDEHVEPRFKGAAGMFVEIAVPFWAAVAQLEFAEWLAERGRVAEAQDAVAEAMPSLERLRAAPFVERARAITAHAAELS